MLTLSEPFNLVDGTRIVSGKVPAVIFDEKKIDAIFGSLNQCRLPGAAVGIALAGRPVYRKGFGLANMELPVVLTPSIRLRIGSTTKHFTCLAYLLLCQDGKAGIDDSVGKYFPELHPVIHKVTMRQLMGNTSGIRDVYHLVDLFNDSYCKYAGAAQSIRSDELLAMYREIDDVNVPPDTTWIYNNGGWLLLSAAIEKISGASLERFMKDRIFEPVGMHDTLLLRSDTNFIENRASQHVVNTNGGFERLYWGMDSHVGAGAMVSTVDDMLRWMAHMDAPIVGNEHTWRHMKSSGRLVNGTFTGYGLGLVIDSYRGIKTLHHGGNALGGNAQMLKVPELGLDVVIIVNRQDVSGVALTYEVLDACVTNLSPQSEPCRPPFSKGTYRSPASGRVVQLYDRDGRQFASVGGLDLPVERDANGVLWCTDIWREGKVGVKLIGGAEAPEEIRLMEFGNIDELVLEKNSFKEVDASRILGAYRLSGAVVEALIQENSTDTVLHAAGPFGAVDYRLEALSELIWRAKPAAPSRVGYLGGILIFSKDRSAFTFSNYQMRSLVFRRVSESPSVIQPRH